MVVAAVPLDGGKALPFRVRLVKNSGGYASARLGGVASLNNIDATVRHSLSGRAAA